MGRFAQFGLGLVAVGSVAATGVVVGAQVLADLPLDRWPQIGAGVAGIAAVAVALVGPLYIAAQVAGVLGPRANRLSVTLGTLVLTNGAILALALGLRGAGTAEALRDDGTWFLAGADVPAISAAVGWTAEALGAVPVVEAEPAAVAIADPIPVDPVEPAAEAELTPVAPFALPESADEGPWTAKEVFAQRARSVLVVRVWAPPDNPLLKPLLDQMGIERMEGQGSAFAVGPDLIVTNHHVIGNAELAEVVLADGTRVSPVEVVALDETNDLALVRVPGASLVPIPLAKTVAEVGDPCYAIGAPLGMDQTLTEGIVSARRAMNGTQMLQMQTPIAPGSSGSPLLDAHGRLIGVNTATRGAGLNLAVDLEYVRALLDAPQNPRALGPPPSELVFVRMTVEGQLRPTAREQVVEIGAVLANAGTPCYGVLPADARIEVSLSPTALRLVSTTLGDDARSCLAARLPQAGPLAFLLTNALGADVHAMDLQFELRGAATGSLTLRLTRP